MRARSRSISWALALTAAIAAAGPALAQAADPEGYGDGYQSGAYGRIRYADQGGTIVRSEGESGPSDQATINAPIFPGDTVRTGRDQRIEIQLAGGSTVRIDRRGEIAFQSMPNPSAKFQDNTVLALHSGIVRVTSRLGEKEEFRIDTPDASVYLLGSGDFRIEAGDRSGTHVASLRGVAEVVGNDASVLVRGGLRTTASAGSAPETPRAYSAFAPDGFDRWCDARDDATRSHDRYAANADAAGDLPEEVQPYSSELAATGTWSTEPDYGAVWYPSGVSTDWTPYSDGYWSYGPGGYFWVSYEPWGWAPYHYGCWQWIRPHGWCWVPGHVFAGAWVSWSWGSLYVGWAPLNYWGQPAWIGGPLYHGYYDPHCWSFVSYAHIHADNVRRYAVPVDRVGTDMTRATVVARAPRVPPARLAVSQEARDRALQQVGNDRSARMSPIETDRRPDRRLSDMESRAAKRAAPAPQTVPSIDRRTAGARPRRILDDPRADVRPGTRDDVRDLYQRMSRPRETRPQETAPPRAVPRAEIPRSPSAPPPAPRAQPQRVEPPRVQAPRPQPVPHAPPPHAEAPRAHGGGGERPKHGGRR
jgi:hypothetical protein